MPSDKRTLALILGASEYPNCPVLCGGDAFSNSAEEFREYLHDPKGLSLPPGDVLNLFDDGRPAGELLELIVEFLAKRQSRKSSTNVERLLVYYVGHGGFTSVGQEYFLAVRSTRTGLEGSSSVRISDLGHIIKDHARFICQYLILDCCFSSQAYKTFQGVAGPGQAAMVKTLESVPKRGTALLCSSGPEEASLVPEGSAHTMFSEALLGALRKGDPKRSEFLSLYELGELIDWQLRETYGDERVKPEVHCPNQPDGDLSHLPLFPNSSFKIPFTGFRSIAVGEDVFPQLPGEIMSAFSSSLPSVRLAAVNELVELCKSTSSRRVADLALTELLKRSEEDDSTLVRNSAKDALAECCDLDSQYSDPAIERIQSEPSPAEPLRDRPVLGTISDLECLNLFLEAAWRINRSGTIDGLLATLLDAALQLSEAERGFVFLRDGDGSLGLVAGRDMSGANAGDDGTISWRPLHEVATGASDVVVIDLSEAGDGNASGTGQTSVICIPLFRATTAEHGSDCRAKENVQGVLYLYSSSDSGSLSSLGRDILKVIAGNAAVLLENAVLQLAEETARRDRKELAQAAAIQQRLMPRMPEVDYARVDTAIQASKELCGDFFDVVHTELGLSVIVADISGKGAGAAMMASTMQGMLHSYLSLDMPLSKMMATVNECNAGDKYAVVTVARLQPNGKVEVINCGGLFPLIISGGSAKWLERGGLPIGLIPTATFEEECLYFEPGDGLVMVTDGFTEAENSNGEAFGLERFKERAMKDFSEIQRNLSDFRGDSPLMDDYTLARIVYRGPVEERKS
jgi:phosphoserine phosphatase RsbU/P